MNRGPHSKGLIKSEARLISKRIDEILICQEPVTDMCDL